MQCYSICLFVLISLIPAVTATNSLCPRGFYKAKGHCNVCRECPQNQIIRQPCGPDSDTICGPFKEFNSFLWRMRTQNKGDMSQTPFHFPAKPPLINRKEMLRRRKLAREWSVQLARQRTSETPESKRRGQVWPVNMDYPSTPSSSRGPVVNTEMPSTAWQLEQWQELCFGLIGGLAVVAFLLIFYILLSHWRAKRAQKAASINDPEHNSIYYRARIFSRDRLNTTDHRINLQHLEAQLATSEHRQRLMRLLYSPSDPLLQGNDYVDEVFLEPKTKV